MWSRVGIAPHTTQNTHTTKKETTDRVSVYRQGPTDMDLQTGTKDRDYREGHGLSFGSFHNFTSVVWIYSSVPKDAISDSCT